MTAATRHLPLLSEVWRLALPVIASNLLVSLVNLVDVFMAGRLGPTALAAQAYGAGDGALLRHVARQSLLLTVLSSLLLGVIGWLVAEPLLAALGGG